MYKFRNEQEVQEWFKSIPLEKLGVGFTINLDGITALCEVTLVCTEDFKGFLLRGVSTTEFEACLILAHIACILPSRDAVIGQILEVEQLEALWQKS